jgi:hypothetical protein
VVVAVKDPKVEEAVETNPPSERTKPLKIAEEDAESAPPKVRFEVIVEEAEDIKPP